MNTPISFEIAKLLKEKGFDDFTQIWYQHGEGISGCVEGKRDYYNRKGDIYTSAPTIAEVVMWLYDKHGIWVYADYYNENRWFGVFRTKEGLKKELFDVFNTQTEAYEAAIEYTLNNLI